MTWVTYIGEQYGITSQYGRIGGKGYSWADRSIPSHLHRDDTHLVHRIFYLYNDIGRLGAQLRNYVGVEAYVDDLPTAIWCIRAGC